MNRLLVAVGLILATCSGVTGELKAAPPDVTSLFPAGAQRGTTTSVTIQGKLGDGQVRVWSSKAGVTVQVPEKPGPVSISVGSSVEPGVSWLRFYNGEGASGLRPFVIGTCHEINETELNDEVAKAEPLPELPVVINGQHGKSGDADSYAMSLRKGQVVVASLMANRILGSPQDAALQMLGPSGFVIEQNEDDQGFDPQLVFTAPEDGIYTLRTWAFPATPDSSIRLFGSSASVYRLLVTTGPFVDHVLPAAVQAGQSQQLLVYGWNLPMTQITVTPPVSAIEQAFPWVIDGLSNRLPVAVQVQPHPVVVEQEPNDLKHPQSVTTPVSISGRISSKHDEDSYRFSVKKGQRLRFEVTARDAGSPLDPVLRILDSTGKLLKEADDDGKQSADPDVDFTASADGDYVVSISDRFLHDGDRFFYILSITEPKPGFSLNVAKDAYVLSGDAELSIPVTINRTNGFAEPIQIEVSGLPASVTVAAVTSEPKGDSAKSVTLKLKSDGQSAFEGPFQITGRTAGNSLYPPLATLPQKAFQADTPYLWMTGTKK